MKSEPSKRGKKSSTLFVRHWTGTWKRLTVRLSDRDTVPRASIAILVNSELAKVGQPSLTNAQIDIALSKLWQLGCIEIAHDPPGSYWLREWVQIDYR